MNKESKDWVKEIVDIMATLRAPGGCSWDQKQTHKSLKPYLIEESCEALDAIDDEDMPLLEEELGDVLMNIVFHAQIATEKNHFTFQDVAKSISEKMIRRHPHVFDKSCTLTPEEVEKQWDEIKKQEKQERESILEGIPRSLPALFRAQKLQKRASKVGFDWPETEGPLSKIEEEIDELKEAIDSQSKPEIEEEFGDVLFSLVNLARHLNIDADHALHLSNQKFINRFQKLEKKCQESNRDLEKMSLEEMDEVWDQIKQEKAK